MARALAAAAVATAFASLGCVVIAGRLSTASHGETAAGSTFTVVGSESLTLTERHIQGLISNEMVSLGFRPSENAASADVAVVYLYSIGGGHTVVSSRPDFVWGGQQVTSSTSYPRYFAISIVDLAASESQDKLVFIWQAEIYSEGSSQNISWLAEHFVPELFSRFGQSVNNVRVFRPAPLF